METRRRSLLKSITWRILAIITLTYLSYIFTKDWEITGWITISFNVIQIFLYYIHERAWLKIKWGNKK